MSDRYDTGKPAGRRIVAVEVGGRRFALDPVAGTLMAGAVIDDIARQGAIAPKVEAGSRA